MDYCMHDIFLLHEGYKKWYEYANCFAALIIQERKVFKGSFWSVSSSAVQNAGTVTSWTIR